MDLETITLIARRSEDHLEDDMDRMRNDEDYYWDLPNSTAVEAETVAIKKLLVDQDVISFKRYLYLAGKCVEAGVLVEPYNTPDSSHYVKPFISVKLWRRYKAFFWALISQNERLMESLAHLLGYKGEEWEFCKGDPSLARFGFILKYLLLGDDEKAEEHFNVLQKQKLPKYWDGHLLMVEAILNQSQEDAQKGLELVVKHHKGWDYGDLEKQCSIPAMGLGWLAKRRGLEVFIDHPLAPGIVYEQQEFTYPETDFLPKEIQDKTWQDFLEKRYP